MKLTTILSIAFTASGALAAYDDEDFFPRELSELDARDIYEMGFLHARSLYEDEMDNGLYMRTPPSLSPGATERANAAWKEKAKTGGNKVDEKSGHLPEKYKPHRPGTPNPNTGSFFSKADSDAAKRGPGAKYRRSIYGLEFNDE